MEPVPGRTGPVRGRTAPVRGRTGPIRVPSRTGPRLISRGVEEGAQPPLLKQEGSGGAARPPGGRTHAPSKTVVFRRVLGIMPQSISTAMFFMGCGTGDFWPYSLLAVWLISAPAIFYSTPTPCGKERHGSGVAFFAIWEFLSPLNIFIFSYRNFILCSIYMCRKEISPFGRY